jgi:hypothetical protein
MLKESLGGKEAKMQQRELGEEFKLFHQARLKAEMQALNTKYERLLAEVPEHKSVRNAKSDGERLAAMKEQEAALHEASELATKKALQKSRNIEESLSQYFRFFHVGRVCAYPVAVMGMGVENIPTVFLGFMIDRRKPNPFAPSSVKLRFAIANGMKYLELPASMSGQISPIVAASISTRQYTGEELAKAWEGAVAGSQAARKKRYIITGNLLQALGKFKGRLIDYTTLSGGNEKGLLMPDNWNPDERGSGGDTISVPVAKAVSLIKSMMPGTNIKCSNGLIIAREYGARFKLYVPASRQGGGDIYMDKDLWPLIEKGMWEKQSDKMIAWMQPDAINEFLALVGDRHPGTVQVAKHLMAQVNTDGGGANQRRHYSVRMPAPAPAETTITDGEQSITHKADELRLWALALELEMEMEMELGAVGLAGNGAVSIRHNTSRNGIEVKFSMLPGYDIVRYLKGMGFRYSKRQQLYYVIYTPALWEELKNRMVAFGLTVNGEEGESDAASIAAAKQRIADAAAAARLSAYQRQHPDNYRLAKLQYGDFLKVFGCPDSIAISARTYLYDKVKKDYTFLPQGRKRPDRYTLAQIHHYLMDEALHSGATIALESYYSNPNKGRTTPEFHLSDLNMLVKRFPQMAEAPDYMPYKALLEQRLEEDKEDARRWGEYRVKVFGQMAARGTHVWSKDEGVWKQYGFVSKTADELRSERSYGRHDTIELQTNSGWITVMGHHLISRVHPSQDEPSFLELHPFETVIGPVMLTARPEPTPLPKESTQLKLAALALELAMEMENKLG